MNFFKRIVLFIFIGLALAAVCGSKAQAASFYFSPSSGSYTVGKTFSVSLYVSSVDQAMNAAQGVINFPPDKLEAMSISKNSSILPIWVQEPSYSNTDGDIQFAGVVPNPGFTGKNGKILSVVFKAKNPGQASLNVSKASVLANDGEGTQILNNVSAGAFAIEVGANTPAAPESTTPAETINSVGVPLSPKISSPTHPDPNRWYNNSSPKFIWDVPKDITAARIFYNKSPNSKPTVLYEPPISEKKIDNIKDGIWYFHVQLKNKQGWGAISHFRFQIDTDPPLPIPLKFIDGKKTNNPKPTILFNTTDTLSGIAYYKIKIGDGAFFNAPTDEAKNNPYTLPIQGPGTRTILVQAFDNAGNHALVSDEFTIEPINSPIISKYPQELNEGDILIIKGMANPDVTVRIFLQKNNDVQVDFREVKSDNSGGFNLIWDGKLSNGVYKFWAEAVDSRGAQSNQTNTFVVLVKQAPIFRIGSMFINYIVIIIPVAVVVAALLFLGVSVWHRFLRFRRRLKKELVEADKSFHSAFDVLRENIVGHIRLLEKINSERPLTREENKIIEKCKDDLNKAEKIIIKEIESIEKQIK
ncbi:hypothetical protein HY227_00130 [Candidatus Wolfebacteria bacterium]|nr:hypothetical protein [Candidatus Wolfebacteria bacterium]